MPSGIWSLTSTITTMPEQLHQARTDALRPTTLADFGGQPAVTGELSIILDAARGRGQLPDHILFAGPPGLGKTSLAHIVAHECGVPIVATSGPALDKPSALTQLLTTIGGPTVLFIDEIHRLPLPVEEILYSAMEDGVLDVKVGERATARVIRVPLRPFCLIGATTQVGMVSAPLRSRIGFSGRLRLYDDGALADIVTRSAGLLGVEIEPDAAREIARRSSGTPRIANRLLRRVRDWVQTRPERDPGSPLHITSDDASAALEAFGVDRLGLDRTSRELLDVLCVQFRGGPVGLTTLAAAIGDTPETVAEVLEPHLLRSGLIARTPRGRVATVAAFEHLGLSVPTTALILGDS